MGELLFGPMKEPSEELDLLSCAPISNWLTGKKADTLLWTNHILEEKFASQATMFAKYVECVLEIDSCSNYANVMIERAGLSWHA